MQNFLKKLNPANQTIACPSCRTNLRFPAKVGKTLRIHCPKCHRYFEVSFTNPFKEIFTWNKKLGFGQNISHIKTGFGKLPKKAKRQIITFIILIFLFFFFLFGVFACPKKSHPIKIKTTTQQTLKK